MNQRLETLIKAYLNGTIAPGEKVRLKEWVLSNKENREIFKSTIDKYAREDGPAKFDSHAAFLNFLKQRKRKPKFQNQRWLSYAAVILLLVGLTIVSKNLNYPAFGGSENTTSIHENQSDERSITIFLEDGSKKVIDKNSKTQLTDDTGRIVAKTKKGSLMFTRASKESQKPIFNDIYIPYGEKFEIALADGTKVWLNSGTRLRFVQNLANTSGPRKVYLDGEAFFDVSKNQNRPFIVETPDVSVQVLGTQFNVNSYSSEPNTATTLVEGSVAIGNNFNDSDKLLLHPNDQAIYAKQKGILSKRVVETDLYTAWMQNRIMVNNLTFRQLMDKLERTYNINITINTEHLNQQMYKGEFANNDIQSVLSTIALSTPFNFKINANEIVITE